MKLVLLPGMDGTGDLFLPLIQELGQFDKQIIPLPESGKQDYTTLSKYVSDKLPNKDFFLIAESFSGPIAAILAKENNPYLKGIIFVATFLSPPNRYLLTLAKALPLKLFSRSLLARPCLRLLLFGKGAHSQALTLFQKTVKALPSKIIKSRIGAIQSLSFSGKQVTLPVAYISGSSDRLVEKEKALEFRKHFSNITIKAIDGPHFLLQTHPKQCAEVISELIQTLIRA